MKLIAVSLLTVVNKTTGFCVDMNNEVAVEACLECQNRRRNTWKVLLIRTRAV